MRLRAKRKRQDPRTERLLQSIATVPPDTQPTPPSLNRQDRVWKLSLNRHIMMSTHVIVSHSHKTLCTRCVSNVDDKNSCSNASSSLVESDCVSAEVHIRRGGAEYVATNQERNEISAGCRTQKCFIVVIAASETHFVAESLITSTVKDALSRTPRETFPATRVRVRPRDQPEPDLTTEEELRLSASLRQLHSNLGHPSNHALARAIRVTGGSAAAVRAALQLRCDVCESAASWTPLASETPHRQRVW